MMPEQSWTFRGRVRRVVDGDTVDAILDVGFHTIRTERLRLLGVNTPERSGPTREAGEAAMRYVQHWLDGAPVEWPVIVQTEKSDAFGRYLARIWRAGDGACLNDDLLAAGHAVPYEA